MAKNYESDGHARLDSCNVGMAPSARHNFDNPTHQETLEQQAEAEALDEKSFLAALCEGRDKIAHYRELDMRVVNTGSHKQRVNWLLDYDPAYGISVLGAGIVGVRNATPEEVARAYLDEVETLRDYLKQFPD